jgi:hypothetical protein
LTEAFRTILNATIFPMNEKIPTGHYCYGYVVAPNTSFRTLAEVDAYLKTLPEDQVWPEGERLQRRVMCPYWRVIGHGRVRCKLTGSVAALINPRSARLAAKFYRKHPKASEREKGFLLGDAVKECNINHAGADFAYPSDQSLMIIEPDETVTAATTPG